MSQILYESEWGTKALAPANMTESAIHIFPSNPNSDLLEYSKGSDTLNSEKVTENWNGIQFSFGFWTWGITPADGNVKYILDNQGTGASQDRVQVYIDGAGLLVFVVHDTDSTQHLVSYDVSAWTADQWHQIFVSLDFNNDTIELYTDGVSRDDTPDNALSSDSIGTVEANSHIGKDTNDINQLNGYMTFILSNRVWTNAEITADNDSGAGTPFVCEPSTLLLGVFE